ncbi:enoyl-CoA hydratase/isomerase family protein [Goodfellowiella coeruleoviolacea]|uniref:Enoyl-CoA hydratase/carnithine racemase n=1 Tax=Goodfellowiella coeruleoviolacea TaxID=334858 RepID=A0AAE3GJQ2_9PSEU|nr:enoyl-CoA hydratase/isomerase family protein [Goodfellowiella coeruleoviolacea]MCP2169465.1 Enoyl-CoA hydratase/carnithine racemase [Goodfellowiella coeruleoviolacea]
MPASEIVDAGLLERGGVRLAVDGARATITLHRPDVLNAQTPSTWRALSAIGHGLPPDVRVVVVRGTGRSFSAGLDRRLFSADGVDGEPSLLALAGEPAERADARIAEYQQAFAWLRDPGRVTVAAVQGHAVGAGFQLALACDLRVLAEDAQLCMAEPSLGLVPDLGGTQPLVHCVGYARAVEICLTSRRVPADEALRIGLANQVVAVAELDAAVDALVERLLRPPAGAVRETLGLLAGAAQATSAAEQLAAERAAQLRRLAELIAPTAPTASR